MLCAVFVAAGAGVPVERGKDLLDTQSADRQVNFCCCCFIKKNAAAGARVPVECRKVLLDTQSAERDGGCGRRGGGGPDG